MMQIFASSIYHEVEDFDDEDIMDRRSPASQQESAREEPFSKEVPEPINSSQIIVEENSNSISLES